jgi:hypothetical protein
MDEAGSRRDAQRRADAIRTFRGELARLEREKVLVLSEEQRRGVDRHLNLSLSELAKRFDIDITESQKQVSWGMRIASTVAGLALCTAAYLFFFRFWALLALPVQIGILVIAPLVLVAAAEFAFRRERTPYFTSLLSLMAFAAFIADVNATGAMFNMTPSPGPFLAWGVFALVLAYRFRLRLPLAAGIVCVLIWSGGFVTSSAGAFWGDMSEAPEPFIAGGAVAAAVALAPRLWRHPEFRAVYAWAGLATVFLATLMLSLGSRSYFLHSASGRAACYQVFGMAASAAVIWFGISRRVPSAANAAAAAFVVFLYCRLVAWWWDWMPRYLFFLIVGVISLALLVALRKVRRAA